MDNDRLVKLILDFAFGQADYLKKEFEEFFPCAMGINNNNELVPLLIPTEDEHPEIADVIILLEKVLKEKLMRENYKMVAICSDVFYKSKATEAAVDAYQVRIYGIELGSVNYYLPYERKADGSYVYSERIIS